ncbi:MAG: hypothetical protein ChlgKO_11570 [Chlamydiales bacterium]
MHIVYYDDTCSLCQRAVAIAKKADRKNICEFKPLEDDDANSLILLEEGKKKWLYGKAVFRLLWLLGGKWALMGWLYILPRWLLDPIYRFIAARRFQLNNKT